MIHLNVLEPQTGGGFHFRGKLLSPIPNAGAVQLDNTVEVAGFESTNTKNGRLSVSITSFVVGGKTYQPKATGSNAVAPGTGPALELVPGKSLEMWFENTSIYGP